jgi:SAM-dependent methyltransferase
VSAAGTWTAADVATWMEMADARERSLAPVLASLMTAAALQPGEQVLDVGSGTGPTTRLAAQAVRPGGGVTAIDLAPELVAEARRRVPDPGITWVVGDAEVHPLPDHAFDAVISRFGVMFFGDPYAAFRNLWRTTRLGGRLAVAVWPPRPEIEYFQVPMAAVERALDRLGVRYDPVSASRGPFVFGDPSFVTELLTATGWIEVDIETVDTRLPLAPPGAPPAQVAAGILRAGAPRELLADQPAAVQEAAREELTGELAGRMTADGLTLAARHRVVTARH